jgi:Flp pilus assembly protein TadB
VNLPLVLGVGWGLIASSPLVVLARRREVQARANGLASPGNERRASLRSPARLRRALPPAVIRVCTAPVRRRRARGAHEALLRELPIVVDLVAVAVGAGCTPYLAIELTASFAPARSRPLLVDTLRRCSLGMSFDDSLRELGRRAEVLRPLAETLRTTTRLGAPIGPALTRLAAEVRADVRRRAETRARTIPVRLCFPLVGCVLPAFACLTVVPVVLDGLRP